MARTRAKYLQGIFRCKNPQKYSGDVKNIIYRSSYELKFMNWCDMNENVVSWSSEETIVPYVSPIDNRYHRYFVDFKIKVKTNTGIKTYLIEVKPSSQTIVPTKGNKRTKTFVNEAMTYAINEAKWNSATEYANSRGMEFKILTEHDLGIKR